MNLRSRLLLITFTGAYSVLAQPSPAQTAGTEACVAAAIPADVSSYLKANFPGWRIKQPKDFTDSRYHWLFHYKERRCPGVAVGHFEPGSEPSYGFLLVPEQGTDHHQDCRLVVVTTTGGRLSSRVIFSQENRDRNVAEFDWFIRPINLAAFQRRFANAPKGPDEGPFRYPVRPDLKEGIYLDGGPGFIIFWKTNGYRLLQTNFRDEDQ